MTDRFHEAELAATLAAAAAAAEAEAEAEEERLAAAVAAGVNLAVLTEMEEDPEGVGYFVMRVRSVFKRVGVGVGVQGRCRGWAWVRPRACLRSDAPTQRERKRCRPVPAQATRPVVTLQEDAVDGFGCEYKKGDRVVIGGCPSCERSHPSACAPRREGCAEEQQEEGGRCRVWSPVHGTD